MCAGEVPQKRVYSNPPHPMQPVVLINGVARFKANKVVRYLVNRMPGFLNEVPRQEFDDDDEMQFAQLLGYSVSGFGDLRYASPEIIAKADAEVEKMMGRAP